MLQSGRSIGQPIDAICVIDHEQRIIEWSDAAAVIFGVPHKRAIGQRCFEVVRGRGPFGRPACRPCCSAFTAIQRGQVRARSAILLDRGARAVQRVRCELFALPRLPGGAVVRLQQRAEDLIEADVPSPSTPPSSPPIPIGGVVGDLAVLANLSTTLSFFSLSSIEQNLERALDMLRDAVGADSAELFLAEREGGMVLSAYRGPFKNAFAQITHFPFGKGYPGLVQARQEPIFTRSLAEDPRYLRTMVKDKGFESYICVPLVGPNGVIGSLDLAWRQRNAPLEDALRLILWASSPLGSALENSLYRLREAGAAASLEGWGLESDPDRRLQAFLRDIVALGNAAGGVIVCYEPATGAVIKRVFEGHPPRLVCVAPWSLTAERCPALVESRGIALYGAKEKWAPICRQTPAWPTVTYCLPIISQGHNLGMVQLGYDGRGPSPPTQYLRLLHEMAQGTMHLLREVLVRQQSQRLIAPTSGPGVEQSLSIVAMPSIADLAYSIGQRPTSSCQKVSSACLDIRCFGSFELYRDGKPVPQDAFGRRASLTMLKILLLHRGRPVSRDALMEHLWPEVDPEAGARRLYVTVHSLRQVLEPGKGEEAHKYVRSRVDMYYFDLRSPVRVDLSEFEAFVRQARSAEKDGNGAAAMAAYEAAATLYRGDLFQDEPYAEWCWEDRESLRQEYLDVARKLAVLFREHGEPSASVECCRRALQVDPLREEIHRELMLSLWKAGRRTEALQQYQLCCQILREKLDVAPLVETSHLYELIKEAPL